MGYKQSQDDYSFYTKFEAYSFTSFLVYVDDIALTGNSLEQVLHVKTFLNKTFYIKDLGKLRFFSWT